MRSTSIVTLCAIALLVLSSQLQAQSQGPWWDWPTIDGNWGGFRETLADRGLVFSGSTVVDLLGNASGQSRAFAPADSSLLALDADLEKLLGVKSLLLHVEFVANAGENLSSKSIGNTLQVATAYAPQG